MVLGKPDWTISGGIKFRNQLLTLNRQHKTIIVLLLIAFQRFMIRFLDWNGTAGELPLPRISSI